MSNLFIAILQRAKCPLKADWINVKAATSSRPPEVLLFKETSDWKKKMNMNMGRR